MQVRTKSASCLFILVLFLFSYTTISSNYLILEDKTRPNTNAPSGTLCLFILRLNIFCASAISASLGHVCSPSSSESGTFSRKGASRSSSGACACVRRFCRNILAKGATTTEAKPMACSSPKEPHAQHQAPVHV